ncbi:hypothetical protein E1A91_D02G093800v1 [Gossypium mustelinum]|uniref:BTB domain-containing protein n=1 Tax=Gossypium mustelinum TaxID=34275 RepID=A0A5D2VUW7_GOSMU|nr:hypothetical protein E1A91_D02G093800v1 [Gossypium mustelinum]
MRRHRYHRAARSESETESESDTETMRCISCKEMYAARDAGRARSSLLDHADRGASTSPGPLFPDVVLVASDDGLPPVPVPAHRAVLVNRSPVFKAMLENEMEESRSGTIKISEVSYDALRAFVNYLYTAEAWLDEQRACEKYQHGAKLVLDAALCLITDNMDKLTKKTYLSKQVNTAVLKDTSIKS